MLPDIRAVIAVVAAAIGLMIIAFGVVATFRVAQESLTNVAKHAHASRVNISIRKLGDHLLMEIMDNGKSFAEVPPDIAKRKQRLGLL